MVGLLIMVTIPSGNRQEFLQAIDMLCSQQVTHSDRADDYVFEAVDTPNRFFFLKQWPDLKSLDNFLKTDRFRALLGAIQVLDLSAKHRFKIGHAWFDKNRCLPFARGIECIVCEEHCPTPEKAIKFRNVDFVTVEGAMQQVRQPYVDDALCIGCGICETKCPLPDISAIFVTSAGEQRHPDSRLPTAQQPLGYGG